MARPSSRYPFSDRHQQGMSLIELMIGMVIGLLVVLVALGTLASTRTTSRAVGDSTRLQQDASTAFRIIGHFARQAGARRLIDTSAGSGMVTFNTNYQGIRMDPQPWQAIWINGTDGDDGTPDTLVVHSDSQEDLNASVDCLGEPSTDLDGIQNTFTVGGGMLRCDGAGGASDGGVALIQGVEDFQVWYGLRDSTGMRYVTATDMAAVAPASWGQVESVRVCLRLAGELTDNPGAATTGCQGEVIANDGRLRRVFSRVFKLRNVDAWQQM